MKCAKLLLTALVSVGACIGFASTANAGYYSTENGVRIYRSGPTPAQKATLQAHRNAAIAHENRVAHHKALAVQRLRATQATYKDGFTEGHQQGYQQAQSERVVRTKRKYNRRRYGRRYTTDLYGSRNSGYSRYARNRHRHRHSHR